MTFSYIYFIKKYIYHVINNSFKDFNSFFTPPNIGHFIKFFFKYNHFLNENNTSLSSNEVLLIDCNSSKNLSEIFEIIFVIEIGED